MKCNIFKFQKFNKNGMLLRLNKDYFSFLIHTITLFQIQTVLKLQKVFSYITFFVFANVIHIKK